MNDNSRTHPSLGESVVGIRDNLKDAGKGVKELVQDQMSDLGHAAAEKYGQGKQKLQALEQSFAQAVSEAPMKSVLIAAGAGLVLGYLWRRA